MAQVVHAHIGAAQARLGDVGRDGRVGGLVPGHGEVATPGLAVGLGVGVALGLLHQQVELALCLPDTSNSCKEEGDNRGSTFKFSTRAVNDERRDGTILDEFQV